MQEEHTTEIQKFEERSIRTAWDEEREEWYFSVVDVIAVLTESIDPGAYWRKLKQRLKAEGNETVTNCHGLKMRATDGKMRVTDVANTEQLLRLIQSIPSPKAEPFKLWLAQVGRERIEETIDPEQAIDRALETYLKKGYSVDWVHQRLVPMGCRKHSPASGTAGGGTRAWYKAYRTKCNPGGGAGQGIRHPDRRDHKGLVWHDHQTV